MTIVRSGTPFERIAIDMYGPLPETARGNSKILVITCYFTKWVEAYALPDETAETVAEALVNDFVWLITKVRKQGRAAKFEHKCKRPYTVVDVMADVTYRIEDKKGKRTVVNGERLITFVKPRDWSSTDGVEDEAREHEIATSVDSESEDNRPDLKPEKENPQRTSGWRERRAPQRYGCT